LIEGTLTAKVLWSRNQREKKANRGLIERTETAKNAKVLSKREGIQDRRKPAVSRTNIRSG
jgi:hypothetical protein